MLRAPIWITSACSASSPAWAESSSSVTTGSPVSARASARIPSPGAPRPLKANGDVRGLNAPPRSMHAPAAATVRATPSVCSRDSTVQGPAISANVVGAPIAWPSTVKTVGSWCASSDDASLYGREIGTTRSTPAIPSSPSSRTPSGSPIAPIAVVSSPGSTSTCTPVVFSLALTASISASPASGVITIITARSQPQLADAQLVGAEMVRQLVAHGARDLRAQLVRIVAEVAQQRVAEDDDPVRVVVARDGVAHVEPVGAVAPALVGDDDRDVVERAQQQVRQVVERLAHELLEVVRVARVERHELVLVGVGREVVARELLRALDEPLELLLVGGVGVVGQPAGDEVHDDPDHDDRGERRRDQLHDLHGVARRQPARERGDQHPDRQGDDG